MAKQKKKIENDCATHGDSEEAKKKFWKDPWTSHWSCKCKLKP